LVALDIPVGFSVEKRGSIIKVSKKEVAFGDFLFTALEIL